MQPQDKPQGQGNESTSQHLYFQTNKSLQNISYVTWRGEWEPTTPKTMQPLQ